MDFPQSLFAVVAALSAYVIAGPVREGVMPLFSLLLIFGVFTLPPRQVLIVGLLTIFGLGSVVLAMVHWMPGENDGRESLLRFMLAALIMPAISAVAYYVASIRRRMAKQKKELRQALALLQEVAIRDDMTGLVNRRHMMQLLDLQQERQARSGEGFCLALIDLDHFKHINDHYGHHVGDAVLKDFALAAVSVRRQTDVLARWGGEEFLLLLNDTTAEVANIALERARTALKDIPLLPSQPDLRITFSAGMTGYLEGELLHACIERADKALYRAKEQGRNCTVIDDRDSVEQEPPDQP